MGSVPALRVDAHFVAGGKYHDIDFARMEVLKLLAEHPQIRTSVACDYSGLERLEDCRFLITYTCDLMPGTAEARQLSSWLEAGGRWIALHGTNSILKFTADGRVDTPDERPDVMALLGTQFKAHPPIGPFLVEVVDRNHELTRGIDDFEIVDELYLSQTTAEIDILMQTDFEGEAPGFLSEKWNRTTLPVLYTRSVGKGGIVYNTLGHCRGHYDLQGMRDYYPHKEICAWNYDVYYELLRRSFVWAMQGER